MQECEIFIGKGLKLAGTRNSVIAPGFSAYVEYKKGQLVMRDGDLYVAQKDLAPGPWNDEDWVQTSLGQEIPSKTYSEEETPIGTWIDGKTVYRKFVRSSVQVPSQTWTAVATLSADTVVSVKVWSSYDTPTHPTYLSTCLHGRVENGSLNIWLDDMVVKANDLIMIEYTKNE